MISIDPKDQSTGNFHGMMLAAVAPRPIAFASTIDENGVPNLAPYSFFNAIGSNPPTLVFSSNVRVRDNTTKDTLHNIEKTHQVVINVVSYNMVRQMALASVEFPADVNEFEKAGFTSISSEKVKPFRIAESPVQFECVVKSIVRTGEEGGAANLFFCEIVMMHVHKAVLDDDGKIDYNKIDLVGRMGGANYVRASGDAVFSLVQPVNRIVIGIDQLPEQVRLSKYLTGSDLAQLANVEAMPEKQADFDAAVHFESGNEEAAHQAAKLLIEKNDIATAWQVLLHS